MHFETPFAQALLDPGRGVPAGITSHTAATPARRFAVYRNNVAVGLVNALRKRFPAVERIVGEEFFAAMARVFVAGHLPRSPLLMIYGDEFPDFIAAFRHAAELPYLADVARLEAARTRAYHAADAEPLGAGDFAAVAAANLADLRVSLHPSVEVVRSEHPIVTIWAMNSGLAELSAIADWRGEDALVARPQLEVEVRTLPPGGAAFLHALARGETFAAAAEGAMAAHNEFDLAANLAGLIGAGLVAAIVRPDAGTTT